MIFPSTLFPSHGCLTEHFHLHKGPPEVQTKRNPAIVLLGIKHTSTQDKNSVLFKDH